VPGAVPTIFDTLRRRARLTRALSRQRRGEAASWLGRAMAEDCLERLAFVRFEGTRALVVGLAPAPFLRELAGRVTQITAEPLVDLEQPLGHRELDLVVVFGELDTVNDLPGALIHLREALASGGMLLASMIGAGSLPKLRQAMLAADGDRPAARIHPQLDSRAASALLQRAGFARQVVDQHALTVRYGALGRLIADLRDQGLGSALADRGPPLGKAARAAARAAFAAQADADGKVSERFEILTLTAWKD
jgi:hypothetical protein